MSEDRRAISDEDLMAYVDGECDATRRRAVEAHMAASPAAAARVESWRLQRKILRAAFARVEAEAPPASVLVPYKRRPAAGAAFSGEPGPASPASPNWRPGEACARPGADAPEAPAPRRWPALLAAFLAGAAAALGGVFGHAQLQPHSAPTVSSPAPDDDALARRALAALGLPPAGPGAPHAGAPEAATPGPIAPHLPDYRIFGARAATGDGAAPDAFCLLYARSEEPAFSLCVAPDAAARSKAALPAAAFARAGAPGGAAALAWRQAGGRYALAGPVQEPQLRDFAARLSAEIAAFSL